MATVDLESGPVELDDVPSRTWSQPRHEAPILEEETTPQDFRDLTALSAQKDALTEHQNGLVKVLYQFLKQHNTLNVQTIIDNHILALVVNYQNEGSLWTFLMQAAWWGNEGVVRWLIKNGAKPGLHNAANQTALDVALAERKMVVVEVIRARMGELHTERQVASGGRSAPIDIVKADASTAVTIAHHSPRRC